MYADIAMGIGQTGTFHMTVEDSAKTIDPLIFLSAKFYLFAGKTPATYQPVMVGVGRAYEVDRMDTNVLKYNIHGFGAAIVFNETIINFRRSAFRQSVDSTNPSSQDVAHQTHNLVRQLCGATNVFPILNSYPAKCYEV